MLVSACYSLHIYIVIYCHILSFIVIFCSSPSHPLPQAKTRELKATLNNEFRLIHDLCLFVLNASRKPDLVRATLSTLHAYLSWVPLGYILESNIVEVLLALFPQPPFRNVALQCLTEVRVELVG